MHALHCQPGPADGFVEQACSSHSQPGVCSHVLTNVFAFMCCCTAAVLLQYKMDKDGANIGVLFDNRVRPQQYSKPGAGYAGGLQSMETL